jgi:hypothetical protein
MKGAHVAGEQHHLRRRPLPLDSCTGLPGALVHNVKEQGRNWLKGPRHINHVADTCLPRGGAGNSRRGGSGGAGKPCPVVDWKIMHEIDWGTVHGFCPSSHVSKSEALLFKVEKVDTSDLDA